MPDMMTDLVIIGPIKNAKCYFAPSRFLLRNNDSYHGFAMREISVNSTSLYETN